MLESGEGPGRKAEDRPQGSWQVPPSPSAGGQPMPGRNFEARGQRDPRAVPSGATPVRSQRPDPGGHRERRHHRRGPPSKCRRSGGEGDCRRARADCRCRAHRIEQAIRALKPVLEGASVEVDGRVWPRADGAACRAIVALLAAAKRLGRGLGLSVEDAGPRRRRGPRCHTTSLVTATLDGLGPIGEGGHAAYEHVSIASIPLRSALLASLLLEPADEPDSPRQWRRARQPRLLVAAGETNETSAALVAAWRERGVHAELVPPLRLRVSLQPGDIVLARLDVLPTLDGVEPGLLELLLLERAGAPILNPVSILLSAHDKLRTAHLLARARLPHPWTMHLAPGDDLPRLVAPVVVKPRFGSWGLDIFRCDSEDELARQLEQLGTRPWFRRHGALLQELVTPRGYDLRVLVAGGTTVGAVERVAAPGEWRTNISLGGRRRRCAPSATASALAEAAAAAIGADFVGVDLLPTDHGHVIVELNAAADFNALYSRPGSDIYTDLAVALGLSAGAEPPTTSAGLARSRAPAALVAAASATVAR